MWRQPVEPGDVALAWDSAGAAWRWAAIDSVRAAADGAGCALIFDEVVTGFRVAPGGAQEFYGVRADIATYGKVIGGGLPFAAIGGASHWLDALGNAGTQAAGLWQCRLEDTMSKQLHNGRAAQSGMLAAQLARHGFTGAHQILEGPLGFWAGLCADARPDDLLARVVRRADDRVERGVQVACLDVVLIEADADVGRLDLDQLRERILQPPSDGNRAPHRGRDGRGRAPPCVRGSWPRSPSNVDGAKARTRVGR